MVFFKIIFLKGNKALILVNVYKIIKAISKSNRRAAQNFTKTPRFGFRNKPQARVIVPKKKFPRKTDSHESTDVLKTRNSAKKYPKKPQTHRQDINNAENRVFIRKIIFSTGWLKLRFYSFLLKRALSKILPFPIDVRLKNIFNFKAKRSLQPRNPTSLILLSKAVYKKAKSF